jgi:hypothetical protein
MADEEQQENNNEVRASLRKQENDFNVIKHRTDTNPLLDEFNTYISGSKINHVIDQKTGRVRSERIVYGSPKANDEGQQTIKMRLGCIINTHTIQGNFPLDSKAHSEAYENYCYGSEVDMATDLMSNRPEYMISLNEFQGIINAMMSSIKPVMSRCIGDEERHSYAETSRHVESHSTRPDKQQGILGKI